MRGLLKRPFLQKSAGILGLIMGEWIESPVLRLRVYWGNTSWSRLLGGFVGDGEIVRSKSTADDPFAGVLVKDASKTLMGLIIGDGFGVANIRMPQDLLSIQEIPSFQGHFVSKYFNFCKWSIFASNLPIVDEPANSKQSVE